MSLWHTLRREYAGARRSVRYDLASRRAAKLAVAFTEEFAPGNPPVPTSSRLVPLTGVALLLAGGAAGAFVAISGGLAAVSSDPPVPQPPAAAPAEPAVGTGTTTPSAAPSPVPARRPGAHRTPGPGPIPAPIVSIPITEGSVLPTAPSVEASSTSPSSEPSASESYPADDGTHTEGPRSRSQRPRR